MNKYELTVITHNEEEASSAPKLITDLGGTIEDTKVIGQRRFAYPIKKENAGYYVSYVFSIDPSNIKNLDRQLTLSGNILRHLMITFRPTKAAAPISPLSEEIAKKQASESEETKTVEKVAKKPTEEPKKEEPVEAKEEKSAEEAKETEEKSEPVKKETPAKKTTSRSKSTEPKEEPAKEEVEVEKEAEEKPAKEEKQAEPEESEEEPEEEKESAKDEKSSEDTKDKEDSEEDRLRRLNEKLDELLKD